MIVRERIAAGWYRVFDENGYLLCTIRKMTAWDGRTGRPWQVTYQGGETGGRFRTLKNATAIVNKRWENE